MPVDAVYADIANLAGSENLVRMAEAHVSSGKPLHGLHLLNIALGAEPDNQEALIDQETGSARLARAS